MADNFRTAARESVFPEPPQRRLASILLLDHDDLVRDSVARTLMRGGYEVASVADPAAALAQLGARAFDLLVAELKLPRVAIADLLVEARRLRPCLPVLLTASYAGVRSAIDAVRNGADGYIAKPFEKDELLLAVARMLAVAELKRQNQALCQAAGIGHAPRPLLGAGLRMRRAREAIERFAACGEPVLVRGEVGTGRRHAARLLHGFSPRKGRPLLTLAAAAKPDAAILRTNLDVAAEGTLLVEEVDALSSEAQALLTRILQQNANGAASSQAGARIVATSSRDLEEAIARGSLRKDLFARISAWSIDLPSLRDRREDIPELVGELLDRIAHREGQAPTQLEPEALRALQRHNWPGNVRELELALERAVLIQPGRMPLRVQSLGLALADHHSNGHRASLEMDPLDRLPLAEVEKRVILDTLAKFEGHRARTATALGIGIRTLGIKLKKWREEGALEEAPYL